jgi:hypothetical protein
MACTEDAAKTKWCPFARLCRSHNGEVFNGQPVFNRTQDDNSLGLPDAARCIGSACMAWEWSLMKNPEFKSIAETPDVHPLIYNFDRGDCGLKRHSY